MKARILIALFLLIFHYPLYADTLIQKYLKIVYPTSTEIKNMNASQAKKYYENLNFWYRVPTTEYPNGLFSKKIKPYYGIFLFPDTVAADDKVGVNFGQNGILTSKPFHGSNKNYIEVTSFGWGTFPYGGFFNWSPGSGIYLNTGGKVIQAYTRIDLLYKLYKKQHKLDEFYKKLAKNKLVNTQIYDNNTGLNEKLFSQLCSRNFKAKPNTLIAGLIYSNQWNPIKEQFCKMKSLKLANLILLKKYVEDHVKGNFRVSDKRYAYMMKEASTADLDKWGYILAKDAGYNVIEYTRAPNSGGTTSFELDDLRWPLIESKKAGNEALVSGFQHYDPKYAWEKVIKNGWLQQRDPFDLDNDSKARKIKMSWPKLDPKYCQVNSGCYVRKPGKSFPKSWLSDKGWNIQSCKISGCSPSETSGHWKKLAECPTPLKLSKKNNLCHLDKFAINAGGNGSFSMTNPKYNSDLINSYNT